MPLNITHKKSTAIVNNPGYDVSADAWNDDHDISGAGSAAEVDVPISIANGGTGATSVAEALSVLGINSAAKSYVVDTIVDLRDIIGEDGQTARVLGYYSATGGGGGPVRAWDGGHAAGYWTDNGGSIIVPIGEDGSGAWVCAAQTMTVDEFGAKGDGDGAGGGTDDSTAILAAYSQAHSWTSLLKFGEGKTYRCDSPIAHEAGYIQVDLCGSTIDFTNCPGDSNGYCYAIVPKSGEDSGPLRKTLINGTIIKESNESSDVDGVYLGLPSGMAAGSTAHVDFDTLTIEGFRDDLVIGDQTWDNSFYGCKIAASWQYGVYVNTITNAGENIHFWGGVIYNCHKSDDSAYGLCIETASNPDIYFHSTSFDFNDCNYLQHDGHLVFAGAHFEDDNTGPMGRHTNVSAHFSCNFEACKFSPHTTERPYLIEVTGSNQMISITDGNTDTYGDSTEILHVVSGSPFVSIRGLHTLTQTNKPIRISAYTNLLRNGSFETEDTTGWSYSGSSGYAQSVQSTTKYEGTYAWELDGDASASGNAVLAQSIVQGIIPGLQLTICGMVKVDGVTAGHAVISAYFYDQSGNQISSSYVSTQQSGTVDWALVGNKVQIPQGCAKITIQLRGEAMAVAGAKAYFDRVEAWIT